MHNNNPFVQILPNINKYEIKTERYLIPSLFDSLAEKENVCQVVENASIAKPEGSDFEVAEGSVSNKSAEGNEVQQPTKGKTENTLIVPWARYPVFDDNCIRFRPKICTWKFISREDLQDLLNITDKRKSQKRIEELIGLKHPKGSCRIIALKLLLNVLKFCKKSNFNIEQTATVMSIFYLTHRYFLGALFITAEHTYMYFKEHLVLHCFEAFPIGEELFSFKESKKILLFFCTIYIKNLPLIRLIALPNYLFRLNFYIEPDPFLTGKKGKKK